MNGGEAKLSSEHKHFFTHQFQRIWLTHKLFQVNLEHGRKLLQHNIKHIECQAEFWCITARLIFYQPAARLSNSFPHRTLQTESPRHGNWMRLAVPSHMTACDVTHRRSMIGLTDTAISWERPETTRDLKMGLIHTKCMERKAGILRICHLGYNKVYQKKKKDLKSILKE